MIGRGSKPETPPQRVESLRHEMTEVLAEQRLLELQRNESIDAEARALHLLDSARSVQARCDVKIAERIESVRSLQDEIDALMPRPRRPADG